MRGAELFGVVDAVGQDEAPFGIGVQHLDRFAGHGGLDVAGRLRSAMRLSSRISTARPASLAMAWAFSAKILGVSLLEGSLTRSRAKFWESAITRPRFRPFSAAARSWSAKPVKSMASMDLASFFSVLYLSDSKSASSAPSANAWAALSAASFSCKTKANCLTERDLR